MSAEVITNVWRIENVWFVNNGYGPGMAEVRRRAKALALAIAQHTPHCADQTAALRKVREAVATADMAVACGGK